jgi:hypothetical protein
VTFLKSLAGLAVAPLAIGKIAKGCDGVVSDDGKDKDYCLEKVREVYKDHYDTKFKSTYSSVSNIEKHDTLIDKFGDMPSYAEFVLKHRT